MMVLDVTGKKFLDDQKKMHLTVHNDNLNTFTLEHLVIAVAKGLKINWSEEGEIPECYIEVIIRRIDERGKLQCEVVPKEKWAERNARDGSIENYSVCFYPQNSYESAGKILAATAAGAGVGAAAAGIPSLGIGAIPGAIVGGFLGLWAGTLEFIFTSGADTEALASKDAREQNLELQTNLNNAVPIKITRKQLESRNLNPTLSTSVVSTGAPVPETFGRITVKPTPLTKFYRYDKDTDRHYITHFYQGIYSAGEGPIAISNHKLGDKRLRGFRGDYGRNSFIIYTGEDRNQPLTIEGQITDEVRDNITFVQDQGIRSSLDSPGNLYSGVFTNGISTGKLFFNFQILRERVPQIVNNLVPLISGGSSYADWMAAFFIERTPDKNKVLESSDLIPHSKSLAPFYALILTWESDSEKAQDSSNLSNIIINRSSLTEFQSVHLTLVNPSQIPSGFAGFNIQLESGEINQGVITGFSIKRLSASLLNTTINPLTIDPLADASANDSSETFNPYLSIDRSEIPITFLRQRASFAAVLDSSDTQEFIDTNREGFIKLRQEFDQPRPPLVEVFAEFDREKPQIASSTRRFLTSIFQGEHGLESSSGNISYIDPAGVREVNDYADAVERYNHQINRLLEEYNEDVEEWREEIEEFTEEFNEFTEAVKSYTVTASRSIREIIGRTVYGYNDAGTVWKQSSNPAEIALEILVTFFERNGLGIDDFQELIDMDSFTEWKDFCNSNNLEFNGTFDFATTVFKAIDQVAFIGFASLESNFGKIRIVIKRPSDLVTSHFHSRNSLSITMTKIKPSIPHAIVGQFIGRYGDTEIIKIFTGNFTERTALNQQTISLLGVTSSSQAAKYLRHQRNIYMNDPAHYTIKTSSYGITCRVGDIVSVSNQEIEKDQFAAKILSIEEEAVYIDQPKNLLPEIRSDQSYSCIIIRVDQTSSIEIPVRSVDQVAMESSEDALETKSGQEFQTREGIGLKRQSLKRTKITFVDGRFTDLIRLGLEPGDYINFGISTKVSKLCKVSSISLDKNLNSTIGMMEYIPEIYDID